MPGFVVFFQGKGGSDTSNPAGSDASNGVGADPENLESLVCGWSVHVSFDFSDRFNFIAESTGALDTLETGGIYDRADTLARKPQAWNIEPGFPLLPTWNRPLDTEDRMMADRISFQGPSMGPC